jgi:hypothetical protein
VRGGLHYEHGVDVGDFNGDGKPDPAVFGYTNTGIGAGGPPTVLRLTPVSRIHREDGCSYGYSSRTPLLSP